MYNSIQKLPQGWCRGVTVASPFVGRAHELCGQRPRVSHSPQKEDHAAHAILLAYGLWMLCSTIGGYGAAIDHA